MSRNYLAWPLAAILAATPISSQVRPSDQSSIESIAKAYNLVNKATEVFKNYDGIIEVGKETKIEDLTVKVDRYGTNYYHATIKDPMTEQDTEDTDLESRFELKGHVDLARNNEGEYIFIIILNESRNERKTKRGSETDTYYETLVRENGITTLNRNGEIFYSNLKMPGSYHTLFSFVMKSVFKRGLQDAEDALRDRAYSQGKVDLERNS